MKKLISILLAVFVLASCVATVGFAEQTESSYDETYENALKLVTSVNKDFSIVMCLVFFLHDCRKNGENEEKVDRQACVYLFLISDGYAFREKGRKPPVSQR